ncbi:MAG TPA: DUF2950 domain-containing protein [Planctomycetota bacterium]|nr:DUF2950 domain-containing protein [Planctomycetota bacterium]
MTRIHLPILLALFVPACASAPLTFESPEAAVQALVDSAEDKARAEELLGPGGFEALRSGDEVADHEDIDTVRGLIREKVAFATDGDVCTALLGNDGWPLPLPLVKVGDRWRFDVEAGLDEILSRRVGRNELSTIETLRACVEAEREYAALTSDAKGSMYAAKVLSSPGKKDGLYWPVGEGETPSPLGPLVAEAATQGYDRTEASEPAPYQGYYYRILTRQGADAPGGARDYEDKDGALRFGFAFLAWPATYGNSGVMTFLVNQQGIVFERDLGADTASAAKKIDSYDPDESWRPTVTGG